MSRRRRTPPKRRPLDVLYEDERWLAVDKPAGVPVHGGAGKTGPSVLDRMKEERPLDLHLVHRLDRGTSGVLLMAKSGDLARQAGEAWPQVRKIYWAVAGGRVESGVIDRALTDSDGRARSARTEVEASSPVVWGSVEASLVRLRIETGRLHQIRRHLAAPGHPVLLDDQHGHFELNRRFIDAVRALGLPRPKHLLLRCARLGLPAAMEIPCLEAPWPRSWLPLLRAGGQEIE